MVARYNQPLNHAPAEPALVLASIGELSRARAYTFDRAKQAGLPADRVPDLQLIATELVTNSLLHTTGGCRLLVWREQDEVICEVHDNGVLTDPLAGRRPAPPEQQGGRGLLMVNDLADLVRTHTGPDGTTQRAHLRLLPG